MPQPLTHIPTLKIYFHGNTMKSMYCLFFITVTFIFHFSCKEFTVTYIYAPTHIIFNPFRLPGNVLLRNVSGLRMQSYGIEIKNTRCWYIFANSHSAADVFVALNQPALKLCKYLESTRHLYILEKSMRNTTF